MWYNGRPIGIGTLAQFMSRISKAANLSRVYTNHCIRATAITILSAAGVDGTDIISVSGHKTIQSLIPYQRKVGDPKRRHMSNLLAGYGKAPKVIKAQASATLSSSSSTSMQPTLLKPSSAQGMENESANVICPSDLKGILQGATFNSNQLFFNVNVNKDKLDM